MVVSETPGPSVLSTGPLALVGDVVAVEAERAVPEPHALSATIATTTATSLSSRPIFAPSLHASSAAPMRRGAAEPLASQARDQSLNAVPGARLDCPAFGPVVITHSAADTGSPFLMMVATLPV